MGAANILPSTGELIMGENAARSPILDLNGFSQTTAGIVYSGVSGTGTRTITNSDLVNAAVFTVNNATDNTSGLTGTNTIVLTGNLSLIKQGAGNLTLIGTSTFSGDITVENGTLIGAGATNSPGITVFGSRSNTRTITVNNGGTLQFDSGNILGANHTATTAPTLVINSGGVVTNGGPATNNALNDVQFDGGTLTSTTGHTSSSPPNLPVYGAWNLNGSVTSTGTSTISTSDPTKGWVMLKVVGDKTTDFNVTSGALTVSAPVVDNPDDSNIGSLSKSGAGTMILSAANTYTGNTTVTAGTLELADNAQLKFVLGATSGVNNSLTGAGTATLDGDFVIDTTAADALSSGSWTLENVTTLTGGAYGATFSVVGFTDAGSDTWTKTVGSKLYTFDETTGILTLTQSGYASWAATNAPTGTAGDDFDGDGVTNGVEYVLGGDKDTNDASKLPAIATAGGNLTFTFFRDQASIDGTTIVEINTSLDLTDWTTTYAVPDGAVANNPGVTVEKDMPTTGIDKVTLTIPQAPDTKKFARLKVKP